MDTGTLGLLDGVPAGADVALDAAGQTADDGALHLARDGLHRLEVAGAGGREAGLDHVHAQTHELVGDLELLADVEADARGLLAVAEGGIEEDDGDAGVAAGGSGDGSGLGGGAAGVAAASAAGVAAPAAADGPAPRPGRIGGTGS